MNFEQSDQKNARVIGIKDVEGLQNALAKQGVFSKDYSLFTIHTPVGNVKVQLAWGATSVGITLRDKPLFLSERTVFDRLKEEVAKMDATA